LENKDKSVAYSWTHHGKHHYYLLLDEGGNAIFSGDTLFIGDVGRPDLAQKAAI
jgi:glyoxylase-like metal-dependent hydrolase (beta-lactamase superfamily II)